MAAAVGIAMGGGSSSSPLSSLMRHKNSKKGKGMGNKSSRVVSVSASRVADPFETLSVRRDASESDVKKAFRRLALQYHPDVCKEDNCNVQFYQINEAYDMVMSSLRGEATVAQEESYNESDEFRGMHDSEWDLWEEWMGWEGAGTRDYTSHINPYI